MDAPNWKDISRTISLICVICFVDERMNEARQSQGSCLSNLNPEQQSSAFSVKESFGKVSRMDETSI